MNLDRAKGIGEFVLKGLLMNNAPLMLKGIMVEYLTIKKVTAEKMIEMIETNDSFWSMLSPEGYNKVCKVLQQAGNVDWLNAEWMIEAVKEKHPAIASLFLGWPKGRKWLKWQLDEIKKDV